MMIPADAPEQLLGLHNGDVVRIFLNKELTGIKDWGDSKYCATLMARNRSGHS